MSRVNETQGPMSKIASDVTLLNILRYWPETVTDDWQADIMRDIKRNSDLYIYSDLGQAVLKIIMRIMEDRNRLAPILARCEELRKQQLGQ